MKHKATIIIAVLEALVLLTMKLMDWKESKSQKPAAGKARKAGKHRVVQPGSREYDERSTRGDLDATYLLAGSSAPDEEIHEKK